MKYLTPKQYLKKLHFEYFTTWLKYVGISFMGACCLWVLIAIKPDFTFNQCLQKHDLDYCNKVIK